MALIYLALGSNIGNRKENVLKAIELLRKKIIVKKISSLYETKPISYLNQRNFYNCVLRAETKLNPNKLLIFSQIIEKKLKRKIIIKNGPRTIDIDILFYGKKKIKTKNLIVPHPKIYERDFVIIPLLEIGKKIRYNAKTMEKTIIRKQ